MAAFGAGAHLNLACTARGLALEQLGYGSIISNMNTKQLANVLIKLLGLQTLIFSITPFFFWLQGLRWINPSVHTNITGLGVLAHLAVGIALIVWSKNIAEKLFKGETV